MTYESHYPRAKGETLKRSGATIGLVENDENVILNHDGLRYN